jgi:UDP-N-acetylmuramoyl-L-alanyl-D-glutamate--2,6-diaminopimelate ligase
MNAPQPVSALLTEASESGPWRHALVTGVDNDSRRLRPGELFLATASADGRRHGLDYLDAALGRGAAALAWEPDGERAPPRDLPIPAFQVPDLGRRVGDIASRYHGHPARGLYVVGITGTDGKTSCAHLLAQALEQTGERCALLGTLGYGLGRHLSPPTHTTPDAVALQRWLAAFAAAGADAVSMEVSSHALDQHRPDAAGFDAAVLTNISRDHLDYHGSRQAYAAAKRRLFQLPGLSVAVLNADDAVGRKWMNDLPGGVSITAYGSLENCPDGVDGHVLTRAVRPRPTGLEIEVESSWGSTVLRSSLLGRFNAWNLLAVLAVLLRRGKPFAEAVSALAATRTVPGRMEGYRAAGRPLVVVDYAHTPAALAQALSAAGEHCPGRLWVVFGCGGERDRGKRALMAAEAARADHIVVTDDNPRGEAPEAITAEIVAGFPAGAAWRVIHDRADAIRAAITEAAAQDVVLVAGKGHETEQHIAGEKRAFSDRDFVAALLAGETD